MSRVMLDMLMLQASLQASAQVKGQAGHAYPLGAPASHQQHDCLLTPMQKPLGACCACSSPYHNQQARAPLS